MREVVTRPWPPGTEVNVFSVAHALPFMAEPTLQGIAWHYMSLHQEQERAVRDVDAATAEIAAHAAHLRVISRTEEGPPGPAIVAEAKRWGADLILIGSHGRGFAARLVIGSVAHTVVLHAPCSVEIVRDRAALLPAATPT